MSEVSESASPRDMESGRPDLENRDVELSKPCIQT